MKTNDSNLLVWVGDKDVWVKVQGRATFNCCVDFKTLVNSLWQQGYTSFRLDLTGCLLMDSTFLGVLSGLGLKLTPEKKGAAPTIQLVNPNERIADLLENLGVTHLFQVAKGQLCPDGPFIAPPSCETDKGDAIKISIKAHEDLGTINPENIAKFKDVRRFLEEDLKKIQEKKKQDQASGDKEQPPGDAPPPPEAPSA